MVKGKENQSEFFNKGTKLNPVGTESKLVEACQKKNRILDGSSSNRRIVSVTSGSRTHYAISLPRMQGLQVHRREIECGRQKRFSSWMCSLVTEHHHKTTNKTQQKQHANQTPATNLLAQTALEHIPQSQLWLLLSPDICLWALWEMHRNACSLAIWSAIVLLVVLQFGCSRKHQSRVRKLLSGPLVLRQSQHTMLQKKLNLYTQLVRKYFPLVVKQQGITSKQAN